LHDIELARIGQEVTERFYSLLPVAEGGRCPSWVIPQHLLGELCNNICQKRTLARLFDHLVGAGEERRWHSNAKRLGGFHIDDQLETSWLLDRAGRL
jgi:hypothetical protein